MFCFRYQQLCLDDALHFQLKYCSRVMLFFILGIVTFWYHFHYEVVNVLSRVQRIKKKKTGLTSLKGHISNIWESHHCNFFTPWMQRWNRNPNFNVYHLLSHSANETFTMNLRILHRKSVSWENNACLNFYSHFLFKKFFLLFYSFNM